MKAADSGNATQFQPTDWLSPAVSARTNVAPKIKASAAPRAGEQRPRRVPSREAAVGAGAGRDGARDLRMPTRGPPSLLLLFLVAQDGRGWHSTDLSQTRAGTETTNSPPPSERNWKRGGTFGFSHPVPTFTPLILSK